MMTAVWKALIAQKAQKISNRYLAAGDGVLDVPYDKVKNSGQPHFPVAVRFVFISVLIIVISVVLIIAVCVAVRLT